MDLGSTEKHEERKLLQEHIVRLEVRGEKVKKGRRNIPFVRSDRTPLSAGGTPCHAGRDQRREGPRGAFFRLQYL